MCCISSLDYIRPEELLLLLQVTLLTALHAACVCSQRLPEDIEVQRTVVRSSCLVGFFDASSSASSFLQHGMDKL